MCDLGTTLIEAGDYAAAVPLLRDAQALLALATDPYNQARVLILLGRAHVHAPDPAVPGALVEQALEAMREIGSAVGEAEALRVLGDLAVNAGHVAEARRRYTTAREILVDAGASTRILDRQLEEITGRE